VRVGTTDSLGVRSVRVTEAEALWVAESVVVCVHSPSDPDRESELLRKSVVVVVLEVVNEIELESVALSDAVSVTL
jgi:hypothetical protein